MKVTKQGHDDWDDLKGKEIQFDFYIPWDDQPWPVSIVFSHTETYFEDPRYPRYYVMCDSGSGYSFWETEEVEVRVQDGKTPSVSGEG